MKCISTLQKFLISLLAINLVISYPIHFPPESVIFRNIKKKGDTGIAVYISKS